MQQAAAFSEEKKERKKPQLQTADRQPELVISLVHLAAKGHIFSQSVSETEANIRQLQMQHTVTLSQLDD